MLLVLGLSAVVGAARVQLFQRPGETPKGLVFFPGEPIEFRLIFLLDTSEGRRVTHPTLSYTVTDFWGETLLVGQERLNMPTLTGGWADLTLELPEGSRGWFRIDLSLGDGDITFPLENPELPTRSGYVTFAIIDPPEPGPRPDSFFGIAEHHLNDANAELMRRAGIRWLRTDVVWEGIQRSADSPFDWSRLDGIFETAERYDIAVLPIIDYTAPFAAEQRPGVRPGSPTRYPPREEDWRHFVERLVQRYRDRVSVWEVWNEANIGFWLGTPQHYAELLQQAYEVIKTVDPDALVSIAGTAGVDLKWLQDVAASGAGPYMDILSVHPYRQPSFPERGLMADLVRVQTWARDELPPSLTGIQARDVWITEMGYHTLGNAAAVSEKAQAEYLVRAMIQALAAGVKRFFWYEFADGGINPDDQEANFGLLYSNLTPKPSYVAYATMERILGRARQPRALAFDDRRIRAYLFDVDGDEVVVAWMIEGTQDVDWPVKGELVAVDLVGRRIKVPVRRVDARDETCEKTRAHAGKEARNPAKQHAAGLSSIRATIALSSSPLFLFGLDVAAVEREGLAYVSEEPLAMKPSEVTSEAESVVYNGSFEEAAGQGLPAGWSVHISNDADFRWEHRIGLSDAPDGSAYVRLENHTPLEGHVYGRIHQLIPVKPWTTYTLSARVRTKGNSLSWIGGGPGWHVRFHLPQDTRGEWVEVKGFFTTASETTWELMILLEDIVEQVDVDDVRVEEGLEV